MVSSSFKLCCTVVSEKRLPSVDQEAESMGLKVQVLPFEGYICQMAFPVVGGGMVLEL